jgi:hypothetical protein
MPLTKVTYSMIDEAPANVLDYGADPTGVADSTAAIQTAVATGRRVRIPKGTYKCNVQIDNKTIIEGDGSLASILKPFDDSVAVLTYTFTAQQNPIYRFWDYHSEVRNVGFFSNSTLPTKSGVGFTFGTTIPSNYQTNDEFANNVKFYGCYFEGFDKAIQFPFGNIGTEIYSCGFTSNNYGIYTINNKFGSPMHCGNKYIFGGEFHDNGCAIYANNDPQAIVANGTIFEFNQVAFYGFYLNSDGVTPVAFNDCWFEGNGVSNTGNVSTTVVLDTWVGTTVTQTTFNRHAIYTQGDGARIEFNRSFFTDAFIDSTNTNISVNNCRVESLGGYGGGVCTVTNPVSSAIVLTNPHTAGGPPRSEGCVVTGRMYFGSSTIDAAAIFSQSRWCLVNERSSKVQDCGSKLQSAITFETAVSTGSGSFSLTGVVVSDGRIFPDCNEFTRASFLSSEFTTPTSPSASFTTTAGWYVFTFDAKRVSGDLQFNVWDRGTAQFAVNIQIPTVGDWYTVAGIGYSPSPQTMYLDFQGLNQSVTWRMSAWQCLRFETQDQAQAYLDSSVYAES